MPASEKSKTEAEDEEMRNRLKGFLAVKKQPVPRKSVTVPTSLPKVHPIPAPASTNGARPRQPVIIINRKRPAAADTPVKSLRLSRKVSKTSDGSKLAILHRPVSAETECEEDDINSCRRTLLMRRAMAGDSKPPKISQKVQHLALLERDAIAARRSTEAVLAQELANLLETIKDRLQVLDRLHETVVGQAQPLVSDEDDPSLIIDNLDQLYQSASKALEMANQFAEFPNLKPYVMGLLDWARQKCLLIDATNNKLLLESI